MDRRVWVGSGGLAKLVRGEPAEDGEGRLAGALALLGSGVVGGGRGRKGEVHGTV